MSFGDAPVTKQAGVGLMLGEERGMEGVVVKQLVPRGSADRTGSVRVGDQLMRVGEEDVSRQTVSNMRHLIIGEIGSFVEVTFRSASGQVYTVQLQRGTPEFLDSVGALPSSELRSHRSDDSFRSAAPAIYRSNNGSVGAASDMGDGRATLQEENDWLRSALRLAEAHINKDKEELKSLHAIFERNRQDTERRVKNLEGQVEARDAERRELDGRVWEADEKARGAETKLTEAARREQGQQEEARKVYENEQMRLEYIQELKRRFEEEKRTLESELVRMHDGLRAERARRIENETLAAQLRQDVERLQEAYRHAISINHHGAEEIKEQADKMRDIQRLNSSLTILLSEIQPRLTVLEQDLFSNRLSPRDSQPSSTASASLADLPASTVPASNVHSPSLISSSRASPRNQVWESSASSARESSVLSVRPASYGTNSANYGANSPNYRGSSGNYGPSPPRALDDDEVIMA